MNSHNRYGRMSDYIIQSSEVRCSTINEGKGIYDIIRPQDLLSLDNINSIIQYFTTHIELRSFSRQSNKHAVTRIRTWVIAATTQGTNHYTITAELRTCSAGNVSSFQYMYQQIKICQLHTTPLAVS